MPTARLLQARLVRRPLRDNVFHHQRVCLEAFSPGAGPDALLLGHALYDRFYRSRGLVKPPHRLVQSTACHRQGLDLRALIPSMTGASSDLRLLLASLLRRWTWRGDGRARLRGRAARAEEPSRPHAAGFSTRSSLEPLNIQHISGFPLCSHPIAMHSHAMDKFTRGYEPHTLTQTHGLIHRARARTLHHNAALGVDPCDNCVLIWLWWRSQLINCSATVA